MLRASLKLTVRVRESVWIEEKEDQEEEGRGAFKLGPISEQKKTKHGSTVQWNLVNLDSVN